MKTIGLILLACLLAGAQPPSEKLPAFETASVKAWPEGGRHDGMHGGPGTRSPGQIDYTGVTLKSLITKACGIEDYQLSGPAWLGQARYDVVAKVPAGTTRETFFKMLQALLAERFSLAIHRETRELPIYALLVDKDGPKMKVFEEEPLLTEDLPPITSISLGKDGLPVIPEGFRGGMLGMIVSGKVLIRANGKTLKDLAGVLSGFVGRPVVDMTGLTARYAFGVSWMHDPQPGNAPVNTGDSPTPTASDPGADVFTAVKAQLGLKLESRKGPVEMIVVDHVEKTPTAN